MAIAEDVAKIALGLPGYEDLPRTIVNSPGSEIFLGQVFTVAEVDLGEAARKFKAGVEQALREQSAANTFPLALSGERAPGRVTSAIAGASLGGRGGDRKDFADFSLRKLKHLSTFFAHWESMPERQRREIKEGFCAAVLGDEFKLRGRRNEDLATPITFTPWPRELCEDVLDAIRARLKAARQSEPA